MNRKSVAITLGLGIGMIFYVTSYNYAYFIENTYQDNIIKIQRPIMEEDNKQMFQTTANIDGDTFDTIAINLDGHLKVDTKFKINVNNKYGVFEDKFYIVFPAISSQSIVITVNKGSNFNLCDFESELPSTNKLDALITYRENQEIYEKEYTIEFIRHEEEANLLKVYFSEKT